MITFRQFIALYEREYAPNEAVPHRGGRTPLQMATARAETPYKSKHRPEAKRVRQKLLTKTVVDVDKSFKNPVSVKHNNVTMTAVKRGNDAIDIVWNKTGDGGPFKTISNAQNAWKSMEKLLPKNAVITNKPIPNKEGSKESEEQSKVKNTRAKLNSDKGGFGDVKSNGRQYGIVGNHVSPKQREKRGNSVKRTTPL